MAAAANRPWPALARRARRGARRGHRDQPAVAPPNRRRPGFRSGVRRHPLPGDGSAVGKDGRLTAATHRVSLLGTRCAAFRGARRDGAFPTQRRIRSLAQEVEMWPEVREAVPGVNNLLVSLRRGRRAVSMRSRRASVEAWQGGSADRRSMVASSSCRSSMAGRADRTWRTSWPTRGFRVDEIVGDPLQHRSIRCTRSAATRAIATSAEWTRALRLRRRPVPVLQDSGRCRSRSGVRRRGCPRPRGPSGWNTIGATSMSFFDATRHPPALLQPGDSSGFRVAGIR